jgi:hypothetical protein
VSVNVREGLFKSRSVGIVATATADDDNNDAWYVQVVGKFCRVPLPVLLAASRSREAPLPNALCIVGCRPSCLLLPCLPADLLDAYRVRLID